MPCLRAMARGSGGIGASLARVHWRRACADTEPTHESTNMLRPPDAALNAWQISSPGSIRNATHFTSTGGARPMPSVAGGVEPAAGEATTVLVPDGTEILLGGITGRFGDLILLLVSCWPVGSTFPDAFRPERSRILSTSLA